MKAIRLVPIALLWGALTACAVYSQPPGYGTPPNPPQSPGNQPYYGNQGGYYDHGYDNPRVDVGFFYDELSPYGDWVRHPNYGWAWFPRNVHAGWRPYTDGRWVMQRLRLDLGLLRAVRLGDLPLRPLGAGPALRLDLGPRHDLGPGLGLLAARQRLRRLGAAAARRSASRSASASGSAASTSASASGPTHYTFVDERRFLDPHRSATSCRRRAT